MTHFSASGKFLPRNPVAQRSWLGAKRYISQMGGPEQAPATLRDQELPAPQNHGQSRQTLPPHHERQTRGCPGAPPDLSGRHSRSVNPPPDPQGCSLLQASPGMLVLTGRQPGVRFSKPVSLERLSATSLWSEMPHLC